MKKIIIFALCLLSSSAFAKNLTIESFEQFVLIDNLFNNGKAMNANIHDSLNRPLACFNKKGQDIIRTNCTSNAIVALYKKNKEMIEVYSPVNVKTGYYKINGRTVEAYNGLGIKLGSWTY